MPGQREIPLFKVHVPANLTQQIEKVLGSGFLNEGIEVAQFEAGLREFIGNPRTLATNSGTSAITLALKLAGVEPGTEVISSPMTCVATNTPIANLFAKPVWCDIDPNTGNINPDLIERCITPKTRAILFVDWIGVPAELDAILEIGRKHRIPVIEDAAHAFGATYKGRKIGSIADFTAFSFQAIKHITTGDGGALSCLDEAAFTRAKRLKWFGIDREATKDSAGNWKGSRWDCDIVEAGFKFHMNNLAAAIGIEQLKQASKIVAKHQRNASLLRASLEDVPGITLPELTPDTEPASWVFMLFADRRDDLSRKLTACGIHNSLLHIRNDHYHCFASSRVELPGVTEFQDKELCIPCGWWVEQEDLDYMVGCIKAGW